MKTVCTTSLAITRPVILAPGVEAAPRSGWSRWNQPTLRLLRAQRSTPLIHAILISIRDGTR